MVFTLTDPALEQIVPLDCKYLFEQFYAQFTAQRIETLEKMREDESQRFVFDEDLMYLTKDYYVSTFDDNYLTGGVRGYGPRAEDEGDRIEARRGALAVTAG